MNLKERLVINYDGIKEEAISVLGELEKIKNNALIESLIQEDDMLPLKNRINAPFLLVIVGEFNTGKSTFINTLLGSEVVPTNFLEETITINRISYGEVAKKEAVLKDGRRIRLEADELEREKIEELQEELSSEIVYVDVQENNLFLKDICIVDTPGLSGLDEEIDEKVKKYLFQADAMIYMASVLSPMSQEEQNFLSTVATSLKFSDLIVVANMADRIEQETDLEKLENLFQEKISAFYEKPYVFTTSSLKKYHHGRLGESFKALEDKIQTDIVLQKDIIQIERTRLEIERLLQITEIRIDHMSKLMQKDVKELEEIQNHYELISMELPKQMDEKKANVEKMLAAFCVETKDWMTAFFNRLRYELSDMIKHTDTVTLQKYASFFIVDVIQQAITSCVEVHKKAIAEELSKEIVVADYLHLDEMIQVNDISWTTIDSATYIVDLVMDFVLVDLSFFIGIGRLIGGYIRQGIIGRKQEEYLNPLVEGFYKIQEEIFAQIDVIYKNMEVDICENLEKTYALQINHNLDEIKKSKVVAHGNKEQMKQVEYELKQTQIMLVEKQIQLKKYQ